MIKLILPPIVILMAVVSLSCKSANPYSTEKFSPAMVVTANNSQLNAQDTLLLSIDVTDPRLVSCKVDFKDGSIVYIDNIKTTLDTVVHHFFRKPGTYNITITTSDGYDSVVTPFQVVVTDKYRVQFKFVLFGTIQSDTIYANAASVVFDDSAKFTAQPDGMLTIPSVLTGVHRIVVSHPWFQSLDTTVSVNDSAIIPVRLNPVVDDCFPLHLNNKWAYSSYDNYYNNSMQSTDKTSGTETWDLVSISKVDTGTFYQMVVGFAGRRVKTWTYPTAGSDTSDTSYTGSLTFFENSQHRLTISSITNGTAADVQLQSLISGQALIRYYKGEEVASEFVDPPITVSIYPNIGINSFSFGIGYNSSWRLGLNLIGFTPATSQ